MHFKLHGGLATYLLMVINRRDIMLKLNKYIIISLLMFLSININASDKFDYSLLNNLLNKYVNGEKVNYKELVKEKENLFRFTEQLAQISPDSHVELFQTRNEKLAYWINAYNAYILQTIVEDYPVESIKDINFIGVTVWLNKNMLGGEKISFKSLEDDIIRERFNDPRIHFAINCASVSCPPIINEVYLPEKLENQMESSTEKFINNENNFSVDEENKIIYISAIFDWYEDDFIDWLKKEHPQIKNPVILDYIKIYYKDDIKQDWYEFDIEVNDYDWSLNE
jgi:uncharacterized protein DUF547